MRVEPFRLASLIEDELGAVGDASGELASLEGAISEVSSRIDYGDSEAYRSYRRYLRDVRLPAVRLQHDYLLALRPTSGQTSLASRASSRGATQWWIPRCSGRGSRRAGTRSVGSVASPTT